MDMYDEKHHCSAIDNLCRICGNRSNGRYVKGKAKACVQYKDAIKSLYGVDIATDIPNIHPTQMCSTCYRRIINAKRNTDGKNYAVSDIGNINQKWQAHKDLDCFACVSYETSKKGHSVKKDSKLPIPSYQLFELTFDPLSNNIFSKFNIPSVNTSNFSIHGLNATQIATYTCSECKHIFDPCSVKTPCEHYFCALCLSSIYKTEKRNTIHCPICKQNVGFHDIKSVDERFQLQIMSLSVICQKCKEITTMECAKRHTCTINPHTPVNTTSLLASPIDIQHLSPIHSSIDNTAKDTYSIEKYTSRSLSSPLSKKEHIIGTSIVRRQLYQAADKSTVEYKTGGQPICLHKIRKARKTTFVASTPLKKRRARDMAKLRNVVSGASGQDIQQGAELKMLSSSTRQQICKMAGVHQRSIVSKKVCLAMKTSLHLTWGQMRKQTKFLKAAGVKIDGEKANRMERDRILGDHLIGENKELFVPDKMSSKSQAGLVKVDMPLVKVKSLREFVKKLLYGYQSAQKLSWDTNGIPEEEIWLKIGGDHGGGSFKLCLQILNIPNPNAKGNTHVILYMPARDIYENLEAVLLPMANQIRQVQLMTWEGKEIKVFLCGDYEFLCKVYGISGARGTHCCLWCQINSQDIQRNRTERGDAPDRTLINMTLDHNKFIKIGNSKKSQASKFHNCIHAPLWNIPISHVCPPYLHILLGITKKHHDLLEQACHKLDLEVAKDMAKTGTPVGDNPFGDYVTLLHHIIEMKSERHNLIQQFGHNSPKVSAITRKLMKLKKKKHLEFGLTHGPIVQHLEDVLKQHHIEIQAYHSRSMVGNHCHKYLKPNVYSSLCQSVITKVVQLTANVTIKAKACDISEKFIELNSLFAKVHMDVCHGNYIPEAEFPGIQSAIDHYMAKFRQYYPNMVIPKQHILEDHLVMWLDRWGVGMALHGEQGVECIHAVFNKLSATNAGVRNQLAKSMAMMKDHHTVCSPEIQENVPQKK